MRSRASAASIRSQFRLELLKSTPRAVKAVERVAQMAEWGKKREGRGARLRLSSTIRARQVAGIAEVSLDRASGQIKVHNFWCAIDCGIAVQPDNVVAQTEEQHRLRPRPDAERAHHDQGRRGRAVELLRLSRAAHERDPGDAHRADPDRQPPDRRRPDGDAAGGAGDRECGCAADRRAAAAHAVHAGPGA